MMLPESARSPSPISRKMFGGTGSPPAVNFFRSSSIGLRPAALAIGVVSIAQHVSNRASRSFKETCYGEEGLPLDASPPPAVQCSSASSGFDPSDTDSH